MESLKGSVTLTSKSLDSEAVLRGWLVSLLQVWEGDYVDQSAVSVCQVDSHRFLWRFTDPGSMLT